MEIRTVNFLVWIISVCVLVCTEDPGGRNVKDLNSPRHRTNCDDDATCSSPTRRPDHIQNVGSDAIPTGDPKRCYYQLNDTSLFRYETLPGHGWDNLRNKLAGIVVNFNYTRCKTTEDGRYIIPDTVYTVPIKSSTIEKFAELFDHWLDYTSTTSTSINIGAGLELYDIKISGTFSYEKESVRSRQINDKSITTRVQVRYVRYTAKLQPDTPFNPSFKARLLSIAEYIKLNKTNMVNFESQLLVRDFGTHVVTSVDSGAALVQVDHIQSSFNRDYGSSKSKITASASASFFGVLQISAGFDHNATNEMIDQYLGNRTSSNIETYGGPVFKPENFSLNDWADSIGDDLVALDRSGDPLYFLITRNSLPELAPSVVYTLMQSVKSAIESYYKFNVHKGCTNRDSPNFSFQANVDDSSCNAPYTNFTFGGVFQTCEILHDESANSQSCIGFFHQNPLSGDCKCPANYETVYLGCTIFNAINNDDMCYRYAKYNCRCLYTSGIIPVLVNSYWCVALEPVAAQSGFLFGGLYSSTVVNPITQTRACPLYFYPLQFWSDVNVCVSDDYEFGFKNSLPFAGFYSCTMGNPLTYKPVNNSNDSANVHKFYRNSPENYIKGCPSGYSQHMASVDGGCELNYCVKIGTLSSHGLPAVRQPPFMPIPAEGFTDSLPYTGSRDEQIWDVTEQTETPASDSIAPDDSGLTMGGMAGISIIVTIACFLVALVAISNYRKHKLHISESLSRETPSDQQRTIIETKKN